VKEKGLKVLLNKEDL